MQPYPLYVYQGLHHDCEPLLGLYALLTWGNSPQAYLITFLGLPRHRSAWTTSSHNGFGLSRTDSRDRALWNPLIWRRWWFSSWEMLHPYQVEQFPTANLAETASWSQEWCERGRLWPNAGAPDKGMSCPRNPREPSWSTPSFSDIASYVTSVVRGLLSTGGDCPGWFWRPQSLQMNPLCICTGSYCHCLLFLFPFIHPSQLYCYSSCSAYNILIHCLV